MSSGPRNEDGITLIELAVVLMLTGDRRRSSCSVSCARCCGCRPARPTTPRRKKSLTLALRPVTQNIRGTSGVATVYPATSSCTAGGSYPTGYTNCLQVTVLRPAAGQLSCRKSVLTYGLKSDGILREDRTDYAFVGRHLLGNEQLTRAGSCSRTS